MKPHNPSPPTYAFGYKNPPQSGNEINGLGVAEKMQARHVFSNATGEELPWNALDEFFSQINVWGVVRHMLGNVWQLRRQEGAVAKRQVKVDDPAAMAAQIKAEAKRLGAGLVGITKIPRHALYEGHDVPYEYAICLGLPMDRTEMEKCPPTLSKPMATPSASRCAPGANRAGASGFRRNCWPGGRKEVNPYLNLFQIRFCRNCLIKLHFKSTNPLTTDAARFL